MFKILQCIMRVRSTYFIVSASLMDALQCLHGHLIHSACCVCFINPVDMSRFSWTNAAVHHGLPWSHWISDGLDTETEHQQIQMPTIHSTNTARPCSITYMHVLRSRPKLAPEGQKAKRVQQPRMSTSSLLLAARACISGKCGEFGPTSLTLHISKLGLRPRLW